MEAVYGEAPSYMGNSLTLICHSIRSEAYFVTAPKFEHRLRAC